MGLGLGLCKDPWDNVHSWWKIYIHIYIHICKLKLIKTKNKLEEDFRVFLPWLRQLWDNPAVIWKLVIWLFGMTLCYRWVGLHPGVSVKWWRATVKWQSSYLPTFPVSHSVPSMGGSSLVLQSFSPSTWHHSPEHITYCRGGDQSTILINGQSG